MVARRVVLPSSLPSWLPSSSWIVLPPSVSSFWPSTLPAFTSPIFLWIVSSAVLESHSCRCFSRPPLTYIVTVPSPSSCSCRPGRRPTLLGLQCPPSSGRNGHPVGPLRYQLYSHDCLMHVSHNYARAIEHATPHPAVRASPSRLSRSQPCMSHTVLIHSRAFHKMYVCSPRASPRKKFPRST